MMQHRPRQRLNSAGDSAPTSDLSENSWTETGEKCCTSEWPSYDERRLKIEQKMQYRTEMEVISQKSQSLENCCGLTETERLQIESFFSGLGTEVLVCSSLVNLYEKAADKWRLMNTGIPVLLHDKGIARSRDSQKVSLILSERGTCFILWQHSIVNLTNFKLAGPAFHTMCLMSDATKVYGFSYDSRDSAAEIWMCIEKLITAPNFLALTGGRRKKKQAINAKHRGKSAILPSKTQISHPCQFQHVTRVTVEDAQRYFTCQPLSISDEAPQ